MSDQSGMDPRLKRHALGFLQVENLPTPEELAAYYSRQYYQSEQGNYRKSYPEEERRFLNLKIEQKAALVDELRANRPPGRLLDVGCGEGFALAWFQKHGWQVEGIDHSTAGIAAMHPELAPCVRNGDLFELLDGYIARGERYDAVWLSNVLEHVLDPVKLLTMLRGIVSETGVLIVTVPNDGSVFQEMLLANGHIPNRFWIAIPDHISYFDYDSLKHTAEATGWNARQIIGDFPIDLFLLHDGSNYVKDRANGPAAHQARIRMELILGRHSSARINSFYGELARVGLGRCLTAFLTPA